MSTDHLWPLATYVKTERFGVDRHSRVRIDTRSNHPLTNQNNPRLVECAFLLTLCSFHIQKLRFVLSKFWLKATSAMIYHDLLYLVAVCKPITLVTVKNILTGVKVF